MEKDHSIQLSILKEDEHILKLLESDLGVTGKVKTFNKKYSRFYFSCKELCEDLSKFGLI
jgi:hypothetical protein